MTTLMVYEQCVGDQSISAAHMTRCVCRRREADEAKAADEARKAASAPDKDKDKDKVSHAQLRVCFFTTPSCIYTSHDDS